MPSKPFVQQSDGSILKTIRPGHTVVKDPKPPWRKFTKAEKAAWARAKFGPKPRDPMKELKKQLKRLAKRRIRRNRALIRKLVRIVNRNNRLRMAKYAPIRFRERLIPAKTMIIGTELDYVGLTVSTTRNHVRDSSYMAGKPVQVERCWDRVHPQSRAPSGRPFYQVGSSLRLIKSVSPYNTVRGNGVYKARVSGLVRLVYTGGFLPTSFGPQSFSNADLATVGLTGPYGPDYGSGSAYGPSAWNKFKPKLSTAGVATLLGESKEFFPMLKQTAKGFRDVWESIKGPRKVDPFNVPKSLADQFLNVQFGWLPFVRDLVEIHKTYTNLDKLVRQSRRDNGRWIRRKGTVSSSETTSTVTSQTFPACTPGLRSYYYRMSPQNYYGYTNFYSQELTKVWFEGSFRYYVPSLDREGPGWDLVNIMRQFGAFPDPSVIWNLTPWSWLVDWHTDVGDVIDNATSQLFNNMASKYAYVMVHKQKRVVNDTTLWMKDPNIDLKLFWYQNLESKTRTEASPFGFNLAEGDYSLRQVAILSALGLSRG